jgi:uncharacterized repeat protein (TIGR03803 family)
MLPLALAVGLGSGPVAQAQPQPTGFTVLHVFGIPSGDGQKPLRPLSPGPDNALYGCTQSGGTNTWGTIFKINRDGSGYTILRHFSQGEQNLSGTPSLPGPYLICGRDGVLYGTSQQGLDHSGMIFRLNRDGSGFTILRTNFVTNPFNLIHGRDGRLYGAGQSTVFRIDTDGSNFAVLKNFITGMEGGTLYGRLLHGSDGALYGTCYGGGAANVGTVFKLQPDGSGFAVLHTFTNSPDGAQPYAGLIEGSDGTLYGTTLTGGTNGGGTVFKLDRDGGNYQVLHHFDASGVGAQFPRGELVLGLNSLLYGTTPLGGTNGVGTIFRLSLDGSQFHVLYHFGYGAGENPYAGLVQGPASDGSGVLYGTTISGGPASYGTLFALVVNPPLTITPVVGQSGGAPVVFWPAWAINYQLQTTTNVAEGPWIPATNGLQVMGLQPSNAAPNAFYRLVWP